MATDSPKTTQPTPPKKLTPAEKIADMLGAGLAKTLPPDSQSPQSVSDIQEVLKPYSKDLEPFMIANKNTVEIRLNAGLPATKELNETELLKKLKPGQLALLKTAEEAEKKAYDALVKKIDATKIEGKPETVAAEKKMVKELLPMVVTNYNAAEAKVEHLEMVQAVTKDISDKKAKGWFSTTIADIKVKIAKATDPKAKEDAIKTLDDKIAAEYTKLSADERKAIVDSIVNNAPAEAAEIDKANPLKNITDSALDSAVKVAQDQLANLPRTVIQTSLTGVPPQLTDPLASMAQKIIPGGTGRK